MSLESGRSKSNFPISPAPTNYIPGITGKVARYIAVNLGGEPLVNRKTAKDRLIGDGND